MEEGARLGNTFCTAGVCSPARASILTGKYCHQAAAPGIVHVNNSFLRQETPFPALLHEAGYHTAHIGKWHLGRGAEPKPGYDYWAGFDWLGEYFDTELTINGERKQFKGFADRILSDLAVDYIDEHAGDPAPFCLYVGLKCPHLWFEYPPDLEHTLDGLDIPKPASYNEDYAQSQRSRIIAESGLRIEKFVGGLPLFDNSWEKYIRSYYRSAMAIDEAVGKILGAIDDNGIAKKTIVLYTSDQGYTLGEHGLTEKHYGYEEVMRVPMMLRYPKAIKPGTVCDALMLNIDIAPTLLDWCGVTPPEGMTGRSWRPLFETKDAAWREDFLFDGSHLGVRTARHKLLTYGNGDRELYDLQDDPKEMHNRYEDPAFARVREDMEQRLARLLEETGWERRRDHRVDQAWLLGPVAAVDTEAVEQRLASQPVSGTPPDIGANGTVYPWRAVRADAGKPFELPPSDGTTAYCYLAFAMERLLDYDPFTRVDLRPPRPAKAWVNGDAFWEITHNAWHLVCNPPLMARENLVVLRLPANGPATLQLSVQAPEGSVALQS